MKLNGYLVLLYSLIVLVGGIIGFIKSNSLISMLSGSIFCVLLLISSHQIIKEKKSGEKFALFYTLALDAFFTFRFATHPKLMPAGMMLIFSNLLLIMLIIGIKKRANLSSSL
ncbi:MAG: hypothetical protein Tsb0015_17450 [Simkaniaceae bacterium]